MTEIEKMAKAKFQEKVKMIESLQHPGWTMEGYFTLQVGPEDAKAIMKQMEAMFFSGFVEGMKVR